MTGNKSREKRNLNIAKVSSDGNWTWSACKILWPQRKALWNQKYNLPLYSQLLFLVFFQDEASQHDIYFVEEDDTGHPPPPPVTSSSQLRMSQSVPVRSLGVNLSQDASGWSGFSQSLSLSQSSQGRLGLSQASQASQPKRKKSRMGFWFTGTVCPLHRRRVYHLE